jgi:hypothetical protein
MPDFRTSILELRTILNVSLVCVDSPETRLIRLTVKWKVAQSLANPSNQRITTIYTITRLELQGIPLSMHVCFARGAVKRW